MKLRKGFTLVELLLYLGLASILLLGFVYVVPAILEARLKNQIVLEVNEQAVQAMNFITSEIRNAESVVSPVVGATGIVLDLDVVDVSADPMSIYIDNGSLGLTRGGGGFESLTNSKVLVKDLLFSNKSLADTAGSVRVEFTVEYINDSNRDSFDYEKRFYGTGSLKYSN